MAAVSDLERRIVLQQVQARLHGRAHRREDIDHAHASGQQRHHADADDLAGEMNPKASERARGLIPDETIH